MKFRFNDTKHDFGRKSRCSDWKEGGMDFRCQAYAVAAVRPRAVKGDAMVIYRLKSSRRVGPGKP